MARLYQVDASFLAGECDPAIQARVDDVVRANAASKIRNMYVRSMGGVRSRPGMRLAGRFEGRQFSRAPELRSATVKLRRQPRGGGDADLVTVQFPRRGAPGTENFRRFIPSWDAAGAIVMEIDFGVELPAGTTISVSARNELAAPENWVTRLYWWEFRASNTDRMDGRTPEIGRWRSGAGLPDADGVTGTREGWEDLAYIDKRTFHSYEHTLQAPASKVQLRRQQWDTQGNYNGQGNPYGIEVQGWTGEFVRQVGAGERQTVRLLDVTWFPGADFLLALHGGQSTLFQGTSAEDISEVDERGNLVNVNPYGYNRETGFTDEMVRTMHAFPTPEGVYLHSPVQTAWNPYLLRLDRDTATLRLEPAPITPPGPFLRNGAEVDAWGPFFPPSAILPWQGRLLVAGTGLAPNAVWASEAGNRHNFRAPEITQLRQLLPSDPFMVTEAGRPLNRILAMHGGLLLVFFGSHGISIADRPFLSALDFGFRENAERGIREGIPPIEIGTGRLVFVDRTGQSVWLMTYANERQGYVLSELSEVAPHLLNEPEDLIWYEGLPEGGTAALVVNANGSVACCAIQPEGEWHAWSLWTSGVNADEETGAGGDIEDMEPYGGSLWAVTRRGQGEQALYLEQMDPDVELDFCHVSEEGTHPLHAAYEAWAAVAVMKDGSRKRLGMRLEDRRVKRARERLRQPNLSDTALQAAAQEIVDFEATRPVPNDVQAGLSQIIGTAAEAENDDAMAGRRARLQVDFDATDVDHWQVGIRFPWKLCTMPFVRRSPAGNALSQQSRTTECFVNVEGRLELAELDARGRPKRPVQYLMNGEFRLQTFRLFSRKVPAAVAVQRYEASHRFVNFAGWYDANQMCVDGWGDLTITSLTRTVEA